MRILLKGFICGLVLAGWTQVFYDDFTDLARGRSANEDDRDIRHC